MTCASVLNRTSLSLFARQGPPEALGWPEAFCSGEIGRVPSQRLQRWLSRMAMEGTHSVRSDDSMLLTKPQNSAIESPRRRDRQKRANSGASWQGKGSFAPRRAGYNAPESGIQGMRRYSNLRVIRERFAAEKSAPARHERPRISERRPSFLTRPLWRGERAPETRSDTVDRDRTPQNGPSGPDATGSETGATRKT
jgi:hypothetical protein